ncbi:hypothetical protein [Xenorhabdus sp. TH1]|uniref:hypothetical protein n=1 Tax=Xenorhabdus sp. TH1 TaxID=3130166 RepID=UPI0030CE1656
MASTYEELIVIKLQNVVNTCESAIECDVSIAMKLIEEFMKEIKQLGIFSPYLPTYHIDAGSHRIRWGHVIRDIDTGKVVSLRDAPKTSTGDYDIRRFSMKNAKLRILIDKYEAKFRILRASIKQTKEITKSVKGRINVIQKGQKKAVIGEIYMDS